MTNCLWVLTIVAADILENMMFKSTISRKGHGANLHAENDEVVMLNDFFMRTRKDPNKGRLQGRREEP